MLIVTLISCGSATSILGDASTYDSATLDPCGEVQEVVIEQNQSSQSVDWQGGQLGAVVGSQTFVVVQSAKLRSIELIILNCSSNFPAPQFEVTLKEFEGNDIASFSGLLLEVESEECGQGFSPDLANYPSPAKIEFPSCPQLDPSKRYQIEISTSDGAPIIAHKVDGDPYPPGKMYRGITPQQDHDWVFRVTVSP